MKKLFILSLFALMLGCSKEEPHKLPAALENPIALNVHCQSAPGDTLYRVEYGYLQDHLITETKLIGEEIHQRTVFEYGQDDLLMRKIELKDLKKSETSYEYNAINQLVSKTRKRTSYDIDGNIVDESESSAALEYENNLLVKEWEYWGGFNTYEYENEKVITKIDHKASGQKHHITRYKYCGALKTEESKETAAGNPIYSRTFTYDNKNRLVTIIEDGNVVEENFYTGYQLTEKRISYFGIDPGYYSCNGNYIYLYEF